MSYLILILPGAILVYAVKNKACPPGLASLSCVKIFVFGKESLVQRNVEDAVSSDDEVFTNGIPSHVKTNGSVDHESLSNIKVKVGGWNGRQVITLLYCFLGLQMSFLVWGILQEKVMTTEYDVGSHVSSSPDHKPSISHTDQVGSTSSRPNKMRFHDSQFLVLVNRILAFVTASLALMIQRFWMRDNRRGSYRTLSSDPGGTHYIIPPLHKFSLCSVSNILSSWCQYEALKYVNFPTQVLSKACKLLPVMIMSKVVSKKKYHRMEYLIALAVSLGMVLFLLGSNDGHERNGHEKHISSSSGYSLFDGLIILSFYLSFDSFTSNWQEKMNREYQASSLQMMAFVNLFSILFTVTSLAQQSHLIPSLHLVLSSSELTRDCILLSLCSASGQLFIFYTINRFGAFTFTFIMTLRQTFAIILSCIIYNHSLTPLALFGVLVVFTGLFAQIYLKSSRRRVN